MRREEGYFILDAMGALILLLAMVAGMSYMHGTGTTGQAVR